MRTMARIVRGLGDPHPKIILEDGRDLTELIPVTQIAITIKADSMVAVIETPIALVDLQPVRLTQL